MFLINKFSEERFSYLKKNGQIIMGAQGLYITREKIEKCIYIKKNITISRTYQLPFLTRKVYILEKEL